MAWQDVLFGEDPGEKQEAYLRDSQRMARGALSEGIGNIGDYFDQFYGRVAGGINAAVSGLEQSAAQNTRSQQAQLRRMLGAGGLIYGQAHQAASQAGAAFQGRTLRQQANMDVLDRAVRVGLTEATTGASIYGGPAPQYQGGRGLISAVGAIGKGVGNVMTGYGLMTGGDAGVSGSPGALGIMGTPPPPSYGNGLIGPARG